MAHLSIAKNLSSALIGMILKHLSGLVAAGNNWNKKPLGS